ncbi:aminotransferase class I/II-fold pyridoxal phosphate-dependent enzyme [Porcipelethomonas sp.]|uniref:aminotransferase class I/II-fold pyridoxal phosphate-dependent enzyme n=1 Tax=Porcipelethomonas sp. TaxID=2981675 RepID=UPI003EF8A9BC
MNTPLYDFLSDYNDKNTLRLHMPGHKGKGTDKLSGFPWGMDITEIKGADSLFEADGIIAQSEKNASEIFGTVKTCYSAGGSTLCIQTMLALMKQENRNIIAVRNVHRSFLTSCALLGIDPVWIYPEYTSGILSGEIPMDRLEKALKETANPCVYITSPDYLGKTADVKAISEMCRKYGAVLLVDNAHGAHTVFTGNHPAALGADMCCDSAHKMLPALTGAAYLHIGNKKYADKAKAAMALFGSTSPSYLIMASLDLCNKYMHERMKDDIERLIPAIEKLKRKLKKKYSVYDGEPFHLTLLCNGLKLAEKLREKNIECEYADSSCIVLLFSVCNTPEDVARTGKALMECSPEPPLGFQFTGFPEMEKAMTVREAALSDYETIDIEKSAGRICAMVNVPCPPAVPVAVSGEVINENCIKIYKNYGIFNINVIK